LIVVVDLLFRLLLFVQAVVRCCCCCSLLLLFICILIVVLCSYSFTVLLFLLCVSTVVVVEFDTELGVRKGFRSVDSTFGYLVICCSFRCLCDSHLGTATFADYRYVPVVVFVVLPFVADFALLLSFCGAFTVCVCCSFSC